MTQQREKRPLVDQLLTWHSKPCLEVLERRSNILPESYSTNSLVIPILYRHGGHRICSMLIPLICCISHLELLDMINNRAYR